MKKSSAAISLVFVGSVLITAGCSSRTNEDEEKRAATRMGVPYVGRVIGGGGRSSPGVSSSARGGFGASGGTSVGS